MVERKSNGPGNGSMMRFRASGSQVRAARFLRRIACLPLSLIAVAITAPPVFSADDTEGAAPNMQVNPVSGGPESVGALERDFEEEKADVLDVNVLDRWQAWKSGITEKTGFSFGGDYTAVGFAATSSPGDDTSASGIARIYGSWNLVNNGARDTGGFVYKIEDRHKYTDIPPVAFGAEVGYAGTPQPVFNNDGFRTTELLWKQYFRDDRLVLRVGFLDVKTYFDIYALASPWSGFGNLAFSTGSNLQSVLPDGAFGAMLGGYLTDNIYAVAGIADRSADPTDVFEGFDTFFNDFDTFKSLDIGYTGGGKLLFVDNAHVSFWQMDDSKETGAKGGWGVNASVSRLIGGKWLPFLRGGWAHDGGGAYENSVSAGFGYMNQPGGNLLGVGINWGRPNSDTFPIDLDDQWTSEVFYRLQLTENIQITSSVQLLVEPALYETIKEAQGGSGDKDAIALFGLRARAQF